jgi:hypothetical protein
MLIPSCTTPNEPHASRPRSRAQRGRPPATHTANGSVPKPFSGFIPAQSPAPPPLRNHHRQQQQQLLHTTTIAVIVRRPDCRWQQQQLLQRRRRRRPCARCSRVAIRHRHRCRCLQVQGSYNCSCTWQRATWLAARSCADLGHKSREWPTFQSSVFLDLFSRFSQFSFTSDVRNIVPGRNPRWPQRMGYLHRLHPQHQRGDHEHARVLLKRQDPPQVGPHPSARRGLRPSPPPYAWPQQLCAGLSPRSALPPAASPSRRMSLFPPTASSLCRAPGTVRCACGT